MAVTRGHRSLSLAPLVAAAVLLAGCSGGDGGGEAEETLDAQRTDVRAAVRTVVEAVGGVLDVGLSAQSGRFEGCGGAPIDRIGAFQYAFRGRLDVLDPLAGRPYRDQLGEALVEAGFDDVERGRRPGGLTLLASDGGAIEVTLGELPASGSYLILDVVGECIDTPDGEASTWLDRPADTDLDDGAAATTREN